MQGLIKAPHSIVQLQVWPLPKPSPCGFSVLPFIVHTLVPHFLFHPYCFSLFFFVGLPCFVSFPPHHSGSTSIHSSSSLALLFPVVPPPPHILLSSVPTFASCTCLSGFCLFIPSSADAFLLLTFSSFPPLGSSLYLFLWVFSLYRHPWPHHQLLFPSPCFPPPLCPPPWFPVSLHNKSRGFLSFFFPPSMALPLSLIPHLHQLLSRPPSLSPLCFPSLFRSIVFTFTFCSFVIPYPAPHTTLPSPRPSSHISISYTPWHAIPLRSLRGTLLFPSFHWSLPSFRISTTDALAADTYVDGQISQTLIFICTLSHQQL